MLGRLLKRKKPRVFLGQLAVAPRTDLKRQLEQDSVFEGESVDDHLRRSLMEIFSLPLASSVVDPLATDLARASTAALDLPDFRMAFSPYE